MDENLVKALVGIAGAIAGALLLAATNAYAANQKIKEVELGYLHKLREGYLENARKLSDKVYIPLNILITELVSAYDKFRAKADLDSGTVPTGSHNTFLAATRRYLEGTNELMARGADAYLTAELEERLRTFNSFVLESQSAEVPTKRVVLETKGSGLLSSLLVKLPSTRLQFTTKARPLSRFGINNFSLPVPGTGMRFEYVEETLAAPFKSRAFEARFQSDVLAIKLLIKEVVLGSHSRPT